MDAAWLAPTDGNALFEESSGLIAGQAVAPSFEPAHSQLGLRYTPEAISGPAKPERILCGFHDTWVGNDQLDRISGRRAREDATCTSHGCGSQGEQLGRTQHKFGQLQASTVKDHVRAQERPDPSPGRAGRWQPG